ncbi:hypothetical protein Gohar_007021 [Gossypium harknessii]|uniref:RNase H type-1 domain-containing protein n=1 Tax=Gossypium harknessii TaxID=34285 RepID=A0A7J9GF83_9ROSI|nr:hypothetical protein [Gossypium harknessii]
MQVERLQRCVVNDNHGTIYGSIPEDMIHAIRYCSAAKKNVEEIIKGSYSWAKQYVSLPKVNSTVRQGTRGVLRGEHDVQIIGFNQYLGKCSIHNAELWGILNSLSQVQEKQCNKVLIQTNSLEAIEAIQVSESMLSRSTLIRCIHHLLNNIGNWALEYIPRKEM